MSTQIAPTVKLNNGSQMPVLGLGTYQLLKDKGLNAIRAAIDIGYRHIDTAYLYRNENLVGQAMREKIAQGVVKRNDMFIVTKLWDIFHEPQRVEYACRKQLAALDTSYIDVYLMHSPVGYPYLHDEALMPHENDRLITNNVDYLDTYRAMEELVDLGLVRSLGLSNFNSEQISRILKNCRIKPVNLQVECHPLLNQKRLIQFCQSHEIVVTAYSPLARFKPSKPTPEFLSCLKVQSIAKKYGKTACQIALRYLLQLGVVVIPKTATVERLKENMNIFDFQLTEQEVSILDEFNCGQRLWKFEKTKTHFYYPYNIEF